MKKIFTLIAIACTVLATATTARAQEEVPRMWWGMCLVGDDVDLYNVGCLGVEANETYDMAVRLAPGEQPAINGATIHSIRFMLIDTESYKDVSVWISKVLPASASAADVVKKDVPQDKFVTWSDGFVEVELDEPYELTEPVYVGYSLTPTGASTNAEKYPMIYYGIDETTPANAFFFKTTTSQRNWQNLQGYPYGCLMLQVLIDMPNLPQNSARLEGAKEFTTLAGGEGFSVPVQITNKGVMPLTSFTYTLTAGGVESEELTCEVPGSGLKMDETGEVTLPAAAGEAGKVDEVTITLKTVNGEENDEGIHSVKATRSTIGEQPERRVLVEEFTGTWCGWCPRGMAALDWLHENYADKTALIAVHQGSGYTPDPMQITLTDYAYTDVLRLVSGFPSAFLNRYLAADPYHGTDNESSLFDNIYVQNDIDREIALPTEGTIHVAPVWNADSTAITAATDVEFLVDRADAPYGIAYVLIEDGLTGKGSTWGQTNYYAANYSAYASYFEGTPLYDLVDNVSPTTGLTYNHVAIATWNIGQGIDGSVSAPIANGETQTYTLETALPPSSVIQDKKNLSLVAILINRNNGKVVNCDVMPILSEDDLNGISTVNAAQPTGTESVYDLLGRRQQTTARGLNIVRSADGKTRKVLVK